MPPAPQQNQDQHSTGVIWIIVAVFAALAAVWYAFQSQLVTFYIDVKLAEVAVFDFFARHFSSHPTYFQSLHDALLYVRANKATVSFNDVLTVGNEVGVWLRIPLAIILAGLTVYLYFSNATRVYKHNYSMKDLAEAEQGIWPQIKPVLGANLLKMDIDKGPWAMAMTPLQFCKKNRLLIEVKPAQGEGRTRQKANQIEVILKRGEANKVFALQLGPLWENANKLPPHTRALFAIFAARVNADTNAALDLIKQLSASAITQLDLTGVNALLQKHVNTKSVQEIVRRHAYVYTVMAAMLEGARLDGVQASSDFLWLKLLDRRLWYVLNTVGRQTPFAESAGPFAHWIAEKEMGGPLFLPMIEEATNALELALREVVYKPDEVTT